MPCCISAGLGFFSKPVCLSCILWNLNLDRCYRCAACRPQRSSVDIRPHGLRWRLSSRASCLEIKMGWRGSPLVLTTHQWDWFKSVSFSTAENIGLCLPFFWRYCSHIFPSNPEDKRVGGEGRGLLVACSLLCSSNLSVRLTHYHLDNLLTRVVIACGWGN